MKQISPDKAYLKVLNSRKAELNESVKEAERRLQSAPSGTLRIRQGKCFTVLKGNRLRYIPKKETSLIKALAQKNYDRALATRNTFELKILKKLIAFNERHPVSALFSRMKPARKQLVESATMSGAAYAEQWKSVRYKHKGFKKGDPVLKSPGGIRMRSKSELLIAGLLDEAGIAFRYEYPLDIEVDGQIILYHPDFYCLEPETRREFVWEHFGLMDDSSYRKHAEEKMMIYAFSGAFTEKNLIMTFEEKDLPFNPDEMQKKLARFLEKLRE